MLIKNLEKRIWDSEGFDVRISHNGRDARDDHTVPNNWSYARQAKNGMTVQEWKNRRFWPNFPGYDVELLLARLGSGQPAQGNMTLGTVRDSYVTDEE